MKQRPQIPPPRFAPPEAPESVMQQADGAIATAAAMKPAPLAIVEAPKPVAKVELLADRIRLENCTIESREFFWIFPGSPKANQVKKVTPSVAFIAHGVIVIDELNIILPLEGTTVRS